MEDSALCTRHVDSGSCNGCELEIRALNNSEGLRTMNSTYFGLLAEFGEANIPLEKIALKYFGLGPAEAKRRASTNQLPVRVFRLGGQKSPWLVSAADLAELIDQRRTQAKRDSSDKRSRL